MPAPGTRAAADSWSAGTAEPAAGTAVLDALAAAQDAFAALLAEADPGAPVPGCAPWTVTDLALHLGGVHRWAAAMARREDDDGADPVGPREPDALRTFYREQADVLQATLRSLGPDAPAYTLLGPGPAAFWHRRQLHETLVHLHDLAAAAGAPHPVADPVLWADAVDEVVTVMTPRQVRLGRMAPLDAPVELIADDAGRSWLLGAPADGQPGPAGLRPEAAGDATAPSAPDGAPVTVAGPARALALLLWGRTPADDPALTVTGDRAALDAARAAPLTP
ncbi:maleylpyruvate isomerase N-terminal domain-containing protein [Cellulosimicrobium cellulans]|uniref:maleylpyruvate isomerase N-terminal domain-containing protein n=1 Tax=Cellulosimicrobium cellulans TaxID=1710 RepID=UPI00130DDB30|nr:maleylpyruvate isomerase N-terminal domain-containing protein [Cellulosimicrobium cellulans]